MSEVLNICFHGIGAPVAEREHGEAGYWISRDGFLRILDEIMTWPQCRISFDDGNQSDVEIGLPALLDRGLTATFFVLAGRLDAAGSLSRADLVDLRSAGMGVGTHGMDHIPWRGMDSTAEWRELVDARREIALAVRAPVNEAALPLGRYDRRLLRQLRGRAYAAVYTSDRRTARASSWLQPRFSVRTNDTPALLRQEVLDKPSWARRMELTAKGVVKRLR